jgi:lipopolysaccharide export system ATP-binding protein
VPSVLFDLSVRNNIATFERAARSPRRSIDERAAEVGLTDRLDVRARELSGGERRRLEVLRALTAEPSVLIVDEPFAGVDPTWARELVEVLRRRAERGMAILIADHRVREALMLCNDALLLADGAVEAAASAAEFAEHPAVRERYLDAIFPHSVDNSVGALEELADVVAAELGQPPSCQRCACRTLGGGH